ncbi:GNAT family N-acetyltransferase, partial [Alicyclobacillus sendaiensis]
WLGNVAVVPDAQGKGVGTRLVQHVISQVEGSGEDTPLVLVARRELAPLYARHGFRAAGEVIRLEAARVLAPPLPQEPLAPGEDRDAWGDVLALDRRAFGADRSQVLQRAIRGADKTVVVRDGELAPQGMGVATASGEGTRLGPIVAQSDIMALNLLHLLAEDAEGPVVIDVWAERASFVHRLRKLGFEERMTSALMIRGNPKRWTQRPELYALLRPALG